MYCKGRGASPPGPTGGIAPGTSQVSGTAPAAGFGAPGVGVGGWVATRLASTMRVASPKDTVKKASILLGLGAGVICEREGADEGGGRLAGVEGGGAVP
jgi:hypothetical protein